MKLSQCVQATGGRLINGDCEFSALSTDTRSIATGDLFVALRGERFDAHDFIASAVQAGACALVVEATQNVDIPQLVVADTTRALGAIAAEKRRNFKGRVVAITGSSGKTSVKGMLASVLANNGRVCATRGNLNNQVGVPLTLMALEEHADFAVVEMGTSAPGEIGYLANLTQPDVALVNNVMPAHIGGFGSLAAIAQEKAEIYRPLKPEGVAIVNLNEQFAPQFVAKTDDRRQLGFYMGNPVCALPSAVTAEDIDEDAVGRPCFGLSYAGEVVNVQLGVMGRHNIANALAAAACAVACEIPLANIARGLAGYAGDKGRMQARVSRGGAAVIDDTYNANPGSVRAAIDYLASRPQKKILVLGDLGELGEGADQALAELGQYAHRAGVNELLTCGPVARHAAEAFGENARAFASQQELVDYIAPRLNAETVVLVKGSRFARMENIVQALCATGEQQ